MISEALLLGFPPSRHRLGRGQSLRDRIGFRLGVASLRTIEQDFAAIHHLVDYFRVVGNYDRLALRRFLIMAYPFRGIKACVGSSGPLYPLPNMTCMILGRRRFGK
jgi:hypothetical protein